MSKHFSQEQIKALSDENLRILCYDKFSQVSTYAVWVGGGKKGTPEI